MGKRQQLIGVLKEIMEEEFERGNKEHLGSKVKDNYMAAAIDQLFDSIINQLPDDELFALPANPTETLRFSFSQANR